VQEYDGRPAVDARLRIPRAERCIVFGSDGDVEEIGLELLVKDGGELGSMCDGSTMNAKCVFRESDADDYLGEDIERQKNGEEFSRP
jgi:hypothetical protein